MKIVVLGGTGTLGRHVVREAALRGHLVRVVSRHPPARLPEGARHIGLDVAVWDAESAGAASAHEAALDAALSGADAVIDALGGGRRVLVEGMRRLLEEEKRRDIAHHVAISIVGCDLVPFSYYRLKVLQEKVVDSGPVPSSILRATQFHDLIARLMHASAAVGFRPSADIPLQPVDPAAVASLLVEAAEGAPAGRLADVGGPQVEKSGDLSEKWARLTGTRRFAMRMPVPGKMGAALRSGGLCLTHDGRRIGEDFATWLAAADTE
jgi:uncharacterized protein YbjT (DUF2867 family)